MKESACLAQSAQTLIQDIETGTEQKERLGSGSYRALKRNDEVRG